MKIEFDIQDIDRSEVIDAMARNLLSQWHNEDGPLPTPLGEKLREAVESKIDELATELIRDGFDASVASRIDAAVDHVLADGWQSTNNYGEPVGPRLDLKARISEQLMTSTGDRYNRGPSVLASTVSKSVDAFLGKEFEPVIKEAKESLRRQLDAKVMAVVADTVAKAVGLR